MPQPYRQTWPNRPKPILRLIAISCDCCVQTLTWLIVDTGYFPQFVPVGPPIQINKKQNPPGNLTAGHGNSAPWEINPWKRWMIFAYETCHFSNTNRWKNTRWPEFPARLWSCPRCFKQSRSVDDWMHHLSGERFSSPTKIAQMLAVKMHISQEKHR